MKANPAQVRYLAILFQDLGYTKAQIKAKLRAEYSVDHMDELFQSWASALIDELKAAKENR
jgi:hypothetical protein